MIWRPAPRSAHPKFAALDARLRALPRIALADRLDVFHSPAVHVRPSLPAVPRLHCPVIATVHDVLPITYYGSDLPLRLRAFYGWNLRRASSSSHVITVSGHSKEAIVHHTRVPLERVTVIHNGIDFRPNRDPSVLQRHGIKEPYLLYAGSFEPRKNLAGALQCYSEVVRAGYPHLLVAIVERRSGHAARIHSLIRELGLEDRVLLRHSLSEPDLRAVYTQAQAVLFPSFAEGFGLPPVQAAACGVPVIVSDLPVLREIMGHAAEYVDPLEPRAMAAAVRGLIESQSRRRDLIAAGTALARRMTADECVNRHVDVYDAVVTPLREPAATRR